MLFFRQLQHLLPDAHAWRLTVSTTLRKFFLGLAESPSAARTFIDKVHEDRLPVSTRELAEWEKQFGLDVGPTDAARRQELSAAWIATGGQSPRYLQDVMHAAGFEVYLHEWWEPGAGPRTPRNPLNYVNQTLFGTYQCSAFAGQPQCSAQLDQPQCDRFLANDPGYLVNRNLTNVAPPPVPNDPATWPYFLYWGGPIFPQKASIPLARRPAFERLLLKLCPAHLWLVTLVTYDG